MIRSVVPIACAMLIATHAAADVVETGAFGAWITAEGHARDGRHVCVLSTAWADTGNGARYFGIKHFSQRQYLTLHVGRDGWQMNDDAPIAASLTIDAMGT